jgi:hypothetical protein
MAFDARSWACAAVLAACAVPPSGDSAPLPIGAVCGNDQQCGDPNAYLCLQGEPDGEVALPQGFCTTRCNQDWNCVKGAICEVVVCPLWLCPFSDGQLIGLCRLSCVQSSDCRPGYFCRPWKRDQKGIVLESFCAAGVEPASDASATGDLGARCG